MYIIDRESNSIKEIEERTFSDLGFREREHLQEWILKKPECLGEELLMIQKEFDGFNDTYERLDLLALDKQGNLVIIENKLDDSGKDVTWQAQKYASYCSTLKKDQIREIYQHFLNKEGREENAEENLIEFFELNDYTEVSINNGQTQRIILIAANFRKEVTSTVLWLLNYKLRIQCFKVTPFESNGSLILNVEQIIPIRESEEYVISMADKTQENITSQEELKSRHLLRLEFWEKFLREINQRTGLYRNVSPSKDNWISGSTGITGLHLNSVISNHYAKVEVFCGRRSVEENKEIFDELFKQKNEIERQFGDVLVWERLDNKKGCRIKFQLDHVDYFNRSDWDNMIQFMVNSMFKLEKAFKNSFSEIRTKLRARDE